MFDTVGLYHRPIHYILDAVPPIHVVSNHVATDKQMAECLLRAQSDSVANHVKAHQSLIE